MSWWQGLVLGVVQGLTEFLPISSSGHLQAIKRFLPRSREDDLTLDLTLDIYLHGATLLAVLFVFRHDIKKILRSLFRGGSERALAGKIILGVVPEETSA